VLWACLFGAGICLPLFGRAIRGDSEATQDVGDLFKDYALGEVRDQIIGAVVGVVLVLAGIIGGFLAYSKR